MQSLDFEKVSSYDVTVMAYDATNNLRTTAIVLIEVLDVNEFQPFFALQYFQVKHYFVLKTH